MIFLDPCDKCYMILDNPDCRNCAYRAAIEDGADFDEEELDDV